MKYEIIESVSNNYKVIKQVYDDRVLIRTNNIIHSAKYNAYMFILSNNTCLWLKPWAVIQTGTGTNGFNAIDTYLIEVTTTNFNYIKTYDTDFENYCIEEKDVISTYDQLVDLAKEQEKMNLAVKI